MLVRICLSVLQMSIIGSGLALVLLALKPITEKRFGPKWQYYIWLVALLMMVFPISLLPDVPQTAAILTQATTRAVQTIPNQSANTTRIDFPFLDLTFRTILQQIPAAAVHITAWLWLFATIVILLGKLVRYHIFFHITYRHSTPLSHRTVANQRIRVRKTPLVESPITIGLCRPVIFLPETVCSERALNLILMHELTHYKRHDLLYKWFVMLVCTIHWFNPIAYLIAKQADEACELSCDWAVVQHMPIQDQTQYMNLILDLLPVTKRTTGICTISMANCKKTIKKRFAMIRKAKEIKHPIKILSAFAAAAVLSGALWSSTVLARQFNWDNMQKIIQSHPNAQTYTETKHPTPVQNSVGTSGPSTVPIPVSPVATSEPTQTPKTTPQDFAAPVTDIPTQRETSSSTAPSSVQMSPPASSSALESPSPYSPAPPLQTPLPVSTASSGASTGSAFIGETRSNIHRIWGTPDSVTPDQTKETYQLEDGSTAVLKYRDDILYEGYILQD